MPIRLQPSDDPAWLAMQAAPAAAPAAAQEEEARRPLLPAAAGGLLAEAPAAAGPPLMVEEEVVVLPAEEEEFEGPEAEEEAGACACTRFLPVPLRAHAWLRLCTYRVGPSGWGPPAGG